MQRSTSAFTCVATWSLLLLVGCQSTRPIVPSQVAILRADSTAFGVQASGSFFRATIPFTYINESGRPVSKAGCGGPVLPGLEKKVGDSWVIAYYPIYPLCLTIPDFAVESGATYRGVLEVGVSKPGHNTVPSLRVDSIDGLYRLRWDLTSGREAGAKGAKIIAATSGEFRLELR